MNPTNTTDQPHDGAAILDALHACLTKYVILPSAEAVDAVVLWIAATHAQAAWAHAPRLVIRAPEKRCGKSRLMDIAEAVSVCAVPSGATFSLYVPRSSAMSPDDDTMICSGTNVRSKPGVCIIDVQVCWMPVRPLPIVALGGITAPSSA